MEEAWPVRHDEDLSASDVLENSFWENGNAVFAKKTKVSFRSPDLGDVVCFQTSGSTGTAKWVVLEKQALLASAQAVNHWLEVDEDSRWGLALPMSHVGGFGVVARAWVAGCQLAEFAGSWDSLGFHKWVEENEVSHVSLVPTQVHDLITAGLSAPKCLRAVVVGGGRLDVELGRSARRLDWPILASYGMTESGSQIATQALSSLADDFADGPLQILPIWKARTSSESLLEISGEGLFKGYLRETPGAWALDEQVCNWYQTRDRARIENGAIVPLGRVDLLVKVLGELVDIGRLEQRLGENFAIVPIADRRREHALIGVFTGRNAAARFQTYQNRASGLEKLTGFLELNELPVNGMGKLLREHLRQKVENKFSGWDDNLKP